MINRCLAVARCAAPSTVASIDGTLPPCLLQPSHWRYRESVREAMNKSSFQIMASISRISRKATFSQSCRNQSSFWRKLRVVYDSSDNMTSLYYPADTMQLVDIFAAVSPNASLFQCHLKRAQLASLNITKVEEFLAADLNEILSHKMFTLADAMWITRCRESVCRWMWAQQRAHQEHRVFHPRSRIFQFVAWCPLPEELHM